jgi:hypothetical protein
LRQIGKDREERAPRRGDVGAREAAHRRNRGRDGVSAAAIARETRSSLILARYSRPLAKEFLV